MEPLSANDVGQDSTPQSTQRGDMAAERDSVIASSSSVERYRQRDLVPSHLYRIGTRLFGSEPRRRRVIESSLFAPPHYSPHEHNLRRTWDGRPLPAPAARQAEIETAVPLKRRHSDQSLVGVGKITEETYRQWVEERSAIRAGLDDMGLSERWLCSKKRTPLENNLLAELRERRRIAVPLPSTQQEDDEVSRSSSVCESSQNTKHPHSSYSLQRTILKEVTALAQYLAHRKQRFVTLLTLQDPEGSHYISAAKLETILRKIKPPCTHETLDFILQYILTNQDNKVDYQPLVKGDILKLVKDYFRTLVVCSTSSDLVNEDSTATTTCKSSDSKESSGYVDASTERLMDGMQISTLPGELGQLSVAYKEEEKKQFEALIKFCRENGIVLNEELIKRVLLLPSDHPKESCMDSLQQPGLGGLLPKDFYSPPEEITKQHKAVNVHEKFGGAYRELNWRMRRRKRRGEKSGGESISRQSGGIGAASSEGDSNVRVQRKTPLDCWLTFSEYKKWTVLPCFACVWECGSEVRVRSRPDFHYKYQGLPDNNAFWPGALLDKLRLWMPHDSAQDKSSSLSSVFQCVRHPKIYNPHPPMVEQRKTWPENDRGYVQFGGQSRKTYAL